MEEVGAPTSNPRSLTQTHPAAGHLDWQETMHYLWQSRRKQLSLIESDPKKYLEDYKRWLK
jgi:hypothetical protein